MNQSSLLQQQDKLDHLYTYRYKVTNSIEEQQMGRYIGDVQTELVLEENHSHLPRKDKIKKKSKRRNYPDSSNIPLQDIARYEDRENIASVMPTLSSMSSSLYKKKHESLPPLPSSIDELNFEGEWYAMTYVSYDVKNSFSTFSGSSDACLVFTTSPITLNKHSESTDVTTIPKYFLASKDMLNKATCFSFHQVRGLSVSKTGFSVLYQLILNKITSSFDTVVHVNEELA